MAGQFAADHLIEEAPVAATGERVGDDHLLEIGLRRLESIVRDAQLQRHVLEREELHAQRGHQIQAEADEQRAARPHVVGKRHPQRYPDVGGRDEHEHRSDERRAHHPGPLCEREVSEACRAQRARGQQMPGREHGLWPERDRRQREPDQHQHQRQHVPARKARRCIVRVGAHHERGGGRDREELRQPVDEVSDAGRV